MVTKGGTVVALGFTPGATVTVDPLRLISEEVVVTGTRYATRAEIAATLDLVAQRRVEPVIGARFPLVELNEAFAAIRANSVLGRIVIDVAREVD
jgi:propanol-preferring alcohol dehydrogenase